MNNRTTAARIRDTKVKFQEQRDVWVASADERGRAHLVPFSLAWDGEHIIVATSFESRTAKNVAKSHQARLAVGDTRDVVIVEVSVSSIPVSEAQAEMAEIFAERTGWDARTATGDWSFFIMTPVTVQAWKSEDELEGRVIMRDGAWLEQEA